MLNVHNVQVSYGQVPILTNIDLEVKPGQIVCLMGRNGVGKTTLLKAVMGILKCRAGKMMYDGRDITAAPSYKRARAGIGYVPQGRGIFPHLTVYENLLMGFEALDHAQKRTMRDSIDEVYTLFPVLSQMGKRVAGTLSGGQQQQLAIGRVLVRRPQLLLLDEPTEGIQPSIVEQIENVIRSLREQKRLSILLVEQFLDFALGVADYCYVMEQGHIVSRGNAKALGAEIVAEHLSV